MLKALKVCVLFWLMAIGQGQSFAVTLIQSSHDVDLTQSMSYWENKTGDASLATVASASDAGSFVTVAPGTAVLNLGFTQSTYWIRFTLDRAPEAAESWVLEVPYLGINRIDLYEPGKLPLLNGSLVQVEDRPIYSRFYAFPLNPATEPTTYYLRISSTYPISLPIRLVEHKRFNELQTRENLFQFLYFGGLLSLLIYNLMLFVMIRDDKYLIYSLFTLMTGLGIFAGNGYASIYLWPNAPMWDAISQPVLMSLAGGLGVLFSMRFLKTHRFLPKTHKALLCIIVLYGLLAFGITLSFWKLNIQLLLFQSLFVLSLVTPIVVSAACIRNIRYNIRSAQFFLAAWGILCIGVFVAAARVFNVVPSNPITLYAVQISSGLEMLLFSLALAYRLQWERAERERVQNELISSQKATVHALHLSEERLEKAVDIRTQKLQELLLSEQRMREQYVRFGALIAHEFRNPLNTIASQASILEMETEPTNEKIQKRSKVIKGAVNRLTTLFNKWLEGDRIQLDEQRLNTRVILIAFWLNELIDACCTYHDQHLITIVQPLPNIRINMDDHLLQIAVLNLIDNAVKYSPTGSKILIRVSQVNQFLGISVSDMGCGIPEDQIDKVLEPYQRAHQEKGYIPGIGLGLAFVNRIVQLHHGRIDIDSATGRGTTVTLWLPVAG